MEPIERKIVVWASIYYTKQRKIAFDAGLKRPEFPGFFSIQGKKQGIFRLTSRIAEFPAKFAKSQKITAE
jgi:hypothetical protein